MTFWDAFWPGLAAFLTGSIVIGGIAWGVSIITRPRILISYYGSTLDPNQPVRWYHGQVVARSTTAALHPRVMVRPPDSKGYEQWAWPGHATYPAIPPTPILIPVVLGNHTSVGGAVGGTGISPGIWRVTPDDGGQLGRHLTLKPHSKYRFAVRVLWLRDGNRHAHQDAEFELRLGATDTEPEFVLLEKHSRARYSFRRVVGKG